MTGAGQPLLSLGYAVAIGLLVGLERGWTGRGEDDGHRVAGIRTFGLLGLVGGVAGLIAGWIGVAIVALSGIVLIVGYDLAQKAVFLNVGSARLQPVDPSKSYAMQVRFDNHKPWDSRAEVGLSNKVKFMMMTFRAGEFMNEFMNANGMTLREPGSDDEKDVLRLNLPRSGAAAREMLRCQGGANPLAVTGEVVSAKPASTTNGSSSSKAR